MEIGRHEAARIEVLQSVWLNRLWFANRVIQRQFLHILASMLKTRLPKFSRAAANVQIYFKRRDVVLSQRYSCCGVKKMCVPFYSYATSSYVSIAHIKQPTAFVHNSFWEISSSKTLNLYYSLFLFLKFQKNITFSISKKISLCLCLRIISKWIIYYFWLRTYYISMFHQKFLNDLYERIKIKIWDWIM